MKVYASADRMRGSRCVQDRSCESNRRIRARGPITRTFRRTPPKCRSELMEPRSRVPLEQRRVTLQVQRPAGLVVDSIAHGLPAGAVPIEVAVLELDTSTLRGFREESHLDFARQI